MWISGGTLKSEVTKLLAVWSEKDAKYDYTAKKVNSRVGRIWEVTRIKKAKTK